jgi:hypothetical protein
MQHWWNGTDRGKPKCLRETYTSATSSTTNLTQTDMGSNPGLHDDIQTTNMSSHGTVLMSCSLETPHFMESQMSSPCAQKLTSHTTVLSQMNKIYSHIFSLKFVLILSPHLCMIVQIVPFLQVLRPQSRAQCSLSHACHMPLFLHFISLRCREEYRS